MTIRELKKEFKLRNSAGKTIENIMVVPFLVCVILAVIKFSILWLIIAGLFGIVQAILYHNNESKWKVFRLDNKDRLNEEERAKVKI